MVFLLIRQAQQYHGGYVIYHLNSGRLCVFFYLDRQEGLDLRIGQFGIYQIRAYGLATIMDGEYFS